MISSMRFRHARAGLAVILTLSAAIAVRVASAEDVRFPESQPGGHARAYFDAYNVGEEAMRSFWTEHGSPAALEQRPIDLRLDVWREMTAEHGRLTPVSVTEVDEDFVEVIAQGQHGSRVRIRFLCEPDAPHGLTGLRISPADGESGGAPQEEMGPPPTDEEIVGRLSAELDSLVAAGLFSGAVRLDKGDGTLFAKAYGLASRSEGIRNRLDTRFNLGSINKIFTSTAIHQLAESGKLGLDDTIDRYLPDYPPEAARKITIRMLMEHRGGVPDVLGNRRIWEDPSRVRTLADWYGFVKDMPLDFEPGSREEYSNGGYVLLGEIIARVSGEDYYDYIRRHIYEPAGMKRTDHYAIDEPVEGLARSYTRQAADGMRTVGKGADRKDARPASEDGLREARVLGRGSPAGGGYSTVEDLVRFARALREGTLGKGVESGLGIAGGSPGVNALLETAGTYTLVVLSNLDPPSAERFARTTGRMLHRAVGGAGGERMVHRVGGGG